MSAVNARVAPVILHTCDSSRERRIEVLYQRGKVYTTVLSNGRKYQLPLKGWPAAFVRKPDKLRKFFQYTWLKAERDQNGEFSHVQARLGLRGGMLGQADVLPMYPGYALGSIITRKNLLIPVLNQRRKALENKLELAYTAAEIQTESKLQQEEEALMKAVSDQEIAGLIMEYKKVCNKVQELYQQPEPASIFEENVPIDFSRSPMVTQSRSFPSEILNHLIFSKDAAGNAEGHSILQEKVEKFIVQLFSQESASICVSQGNIEGVVNNIERMLKVEDQISLVGSFITLPRVRVFENVRLVKDYKPGKEMAKNAENYYVLTETVLGAFFLGLGKYSARDEVGDRAGTETLMTQLAMISFISQGAIPKTSRDAQDVNLWNVYTQWKEALKDPESGYPIGFRVRPLVDVFRENRIELEKESGAIPLPAAPPQKK